MRALATILLAVLLAPLLAISVPAGAQDTMPPAPYANRELPNPAQEAKAEALMATIRCVKCQSQSIASSEADMAGDLRSEIRERIAAGESPEHIRAWLIKRYGDYVSYKPRLTTVTWPLFVIPVLLLLLAGIIIAGRMRRRQ